MNKILTWQHQDGPLKGKYYCTVGWEPFPIAEARYTTNSYDDNGDAIDEAEEWINGQTTKNTGCVLEEEE